MLEIDLTQDSWWKAPKGSRYVPLGAEAGSASVRARRRIERATAGTDHEVWGTLGAWGDDTTSGWQGTLQLSRQGDEHSRVEQSGSATLELIEHVKRASDASATGARVRERFVDLSGLELGSTLPASFAIDEEPALRLTIFVRPDEGALVVLQHGRFGEEGVDFIQPEPTLNHSCSARDRLTYRVPLPLDGRLQPEPGTLTVTRQSSTGSIAKGTSIKILTFPRGNSSSSEVIARALGVLGRNKYALLKWDLARARFVEVEASQVRRDVKTLMLLHGTLSSTQGSFGHLAENGDDSWLSTLMLTQQRYAQILAFDHDTILHGVQKNADELRLRLGGGFLQPIDLITHSRGGLLGKELAIYQEGLEVRRAAMTACANGVGYFRFARGVSRFLTILYRLESLSTLGSALVTLAQHSIQAVLTLDGLKVMIPGSEALERLAQRSIPSGRAQTQFLPVVGDYERYLLQRDKFYQRLAAGGLDLLLKTILGGQHDWVVGTQEQGLLAPDSAAPGAPFAVESWHTTYYGRPEVRARLLEFLTV